MPKTQLDNAEFTIKLLKKSPKPMVITTPTAEKIAKSVVKPVKPAQPQVQASDNPQVNHLAHYYAASQVDRRAMPQLSIDSRDLDSELSSGLPIKLRLYVNTFGRLVKIERIGVLDQDIAFVQQLEQQLYKVSFLPARHDGADVDSYMEVEFSFNQLASLNN